MEPKELTEPTRKRPSFFLGFILLVALIIVLVLVLTHHKTSPTANLSYATVSITSHGFVPSVLKVKPNTQVTWINDDVNPHRVASDPYPTDTELPALNAPLVLATNDSFSYTFQKAGTYSYHDQLNPFTFKGTVTVSSTAAVTVTATTTQNPVNSTGAISGSISSSGSGLSGAQVQLTKGATIDTFITTSSGTYSIPNVPIGNYNLNVSAHGYSSSSRSVIVLANKTKTLNFTLTKQAGKD